MSALSGLRVVDMSRHLPGPLCSQMLGDFGADVIKVEPLPNGDPLRWRRGASREENQGFALVNRNKRSVAMDLSCHEAREALERLVATADVFLESFRPGVADQLGVSYARMREVNPRLVYCSLTGYGQTGPHRGRPGHDVNFLAQSGILDATRDREGRPVLPGAAIADVGGGAMAAALAILTALLYRDRTGHGQHLDVAMLDALLPMLYFRWSAHANGGLPPLHTGEYACYNVYRTRDGGFVALGMMEEKFWGAFCERIGRPQWRPLQFQAAAQAGLRDELQELMLQRTRDGWTAFLEGLDACFSPVLAFEEIFNDPQLTERGMFLGLRRESGAAVTAPGYPFKMGRTPGELRMGVPGLGAHTAEVLEELGYTRDEIAGIAGELTS